MWEGIYTVNYVPAKDYLDRYKVICYSTAFEVCLMNFLELVSEGKQFLDVGDSATQIMQNLKTVFFYERESGYGNSFHILFKEVFGTVR